MHRFLSSKIRQTQANVYTSVMRSNRFSSSVPEDLVTKLAFVGGGQMAEAILNSLIKDSVQSTRNIHIYDTNFERVKYLAEKYDITPSYDVQSCVDKAEIVVVAVKPQNIDELAESLETPPEGLILSIVAGCTISNLRNKFRTKKIMRTMPNTPSMIAEGITVWTTTKETSKELRDKGEKLISSIGDQVQVSNEKYLDMATAISGSGPAVRTIPPYITYIFYTISCTYCSIDLLIFTTILYLCIQNLYYLYSKSTYLH